jgi:hypothetical protein
VTKSSGKCVSNGPMNQLFDVYNNNNKCIYTRPYLPCLYPRLSYHRYYTSREEGCRDFLFGVGGRHVVEQERKGRGRT